MNLAHTAFTCLATAVSSGALLAGSAGAQCFIDEISPTPAMALWLENGLLMAGGQGPVRVFQRTGSTWTLAQDVVPSSTGGAFGSSIARAGTTAVFGAPNASQGTMPLQGAAFVFTFGGGAWVERKKLIPPDGGSFDRFGTSVALDDPYVLVGSPHADAFGVDAGAVYVYVRQSGTWGYVGRFAASDTAADDAFGASLASSGTTLVVGAAGDDDAGLDSGSVYVFERQSTVWVEVQKLVATQTTPGNRLGTAVALRGDRLLAGGRGDPSNESGRAGSAFVFERQAGTWTEVAQLEAPDGRTGDFFGFAVSLDVDLAVVGAPGDDDLASGTGSAHVFRRVGGSWVHSAKLARPDAHQADGFGQSVLASSGMLLVGLHGSIAGGASGAVHELSLQSCLDPGTASCFGTGCPCGNDHAQGGCVNSSGVGATLRASGSTRVSADDLVLTVSGAPPLSYGVFLAGTGPLTGPFADGLRCVGSIAHRYFTQPTDFVGAVALNRPVLRAPPGTIAPGLTVSFQLWFRDVTCGPPPAPCASPCGTNSNLSNAYSVAFLP